MDRALGLDERGGFLDRRGGFGFFAGFGDLGFYGEVVEADY